MEEETKKTRKRRTMRYEYGTAHHEANPGNGPMARQRAAGRLDGDVDPDGDVDVGDGRPYVHDCSGRLQHTDEGK